MSAVRKSEIDMTQGALMPKIVLFALPLVVSGVMQLLFNAADIVVAGRFGGGNALAAVGSNSSLINLFLNLFLGLSTATSMLASYYVGAKNEKMQSAVAHTAVASSLLLGILVAAIGIVFCRPMLQFMDCPEEIIDDATLYMRIYFAGSPFSLLYNYGSAIIRANGDTRRPMMYLILAGAINVILNLVFAMCFKMYVSGVAIATITAQGISSILVFIRLQKLDNACKINIKNLKVDKIIFKKLMKLGIPAGIQGIVFSLSNVLIQSSVNSFGADAMAGNAAANSIEGFIYVSMNAFQHAALNFSGQNVGAGKFKRVKKAMFMCVGLVMAIGITESIIVWLNAEELLSIYAPGQKAAIAVGITKFRYVAMPYFLCGIMEVLIGTLRGMGSSITPMIISICGSCALRIIWIYTVFRSIGTLGSVFVSYPISWTLCIIAMSVAVSVRKRRLQNENVV